MVIPSTAYGLAVLLVLVLPGVVYAAVRTAVRGFGAHDCSVSARILQAILVGALLNVVYLLVLGNWVIDLIRGDERILERPRLVALAALGLGVAIPAMLAYFIHGRPRWERPHARLLRSLSWLRWPVARTGFESTPTAWDKVTTQPGGRWVRIRVAEGKWVGGWFGNRSYVSTYPEPRDIYIEEQHHVAKGGQIGEQVRGSAGVWLALTEGDVVEWIEP